MNNVPTCIINKPLSSAGYITLFLAACIIRIIVFYSYIQYEQRYCQPDTQGYTIPALALTRGMGMYMPNGSPIFWRTPGYPLFLAPFYYISNADSWRFEDHTLSHKAAVVVQILWCSLLPLLLYILAFVLTGSLLVSYLLAYIGIFHPGAVLASTFLLTDGPAQIFFTIFMIAIGSLLFIKSAYKKPYRYLIVAALALSAYTWMRPMGQFVAIVITVLIGCAPSRSAKERIKKILFFLTIFFVSLAPWFIRNYSITEKLFFCPLFGLYFNVFNAPKIRARIENISHEQAWKLQCYDAQQEIIKEYQQVALNHIKKNIVHETICMRSAMKWINGYPLYFMYDWIIEVLKTTFDLYSYQLVSLHNNTFKWDPLVEYLGDKYAETLYTKELPWYMRVIAYLELLTTLFLWVGIIVGTVLLVTKKARKKLFSVWAVCGIIIGSVVCQTGGFGYARLRLPVEPLIIILGIVCWVYIYNTYIKKLSE